MNLAKMLTIGAWLPLKEIHKAAWTEAVELTRRWDVPQECQSIPDLCDVRPRLFGLANGSRLAGRMREEDAQAGFLSPASPLLFALLPVLSVLAVLFQSLLGDAGLFLPLAAAVALIAAIGNVAGPAWAIASTVFGVALPVFGTRAIAALGHGGSRMGPDLMVLVMTWLAPITLVLIAASVIFAKPRLRLLTKWCVGAIALQFAAAILPAGLSQLFWVALACCLGPAYARYCLNQRWLALELQGNVCQLESLSAGRLSNAYNARLLQAQNAAKDTSTVIQLGSSLGIFSNRYDGFSPDKGLPFCISAHDMWTHFALFGATGEGKTTLMRRMVYDYMRHRQGGVIIFDGKGGLPGEFAGWPGYTLIQPGHCDLALLDGLSPHDIQYAVDQVSNTESAQTSSSGQFFRTAAGTMLIHTAVLLEASIRGEIERKKEEPDYQPEWAWCWADLVTMAALIQQDTETRKDNTAVLLELIRRALPHEVEPGSMVYSALKYVDGDLRGMDEKTRSNIYQTLCGWLHPIMQHPDLLSWAYCVKGTDPTVCLDGGMVGVNVPPFRYGQPGKLVQTLVKQRVYTAMRARGERWRNEKDGGTSVLIVVDEAHELCGDADINMLKVARGHGGQCFFATQDVEAYQVKMGRDGASGFLNNFRSFAVLNSSRATVEWAQERLGKTRSLVFGHSGVAVDYRYAWKLLHESPLADSTHPGAKFYARRRRWGAGRLADDRAPRKPIQGPNGTIIMPSEGFGLTDHLTVTGARGGEWKVQPLLNDDDVDLLSEKGVAIVEVMRGGVRRRDIVKLDYMPELPAFPKPQAAAA